MTLTKTRPFKTLQHDRPVFVKTPFRSIGRSWKKDDEYKWKELGLEGKKVERLYLQGFLKHDPDLENEMAVGDGLDAMSTESLHTLVDSLNEKVEKKVNNKTEYARKKCKKSSVHDKQIHLIRQWRRTYGKQFEATQ